MVCESCTGITKIRENGRQRRFALLLQQGNIISKWGFGKINAVALNKGHEQQQKKFNK